AALGARQKIRCACWRERRAGRCKAPRRRRCGGIVEERQRRRCPPAAAPLRAAARRPAGCVARSLHTAAGMLVARALPAGLGASSKMYTLFPDGPLLPLLQVGWPLSIAISALSCGDPFREIRGIRGGVFLRTNALRGPFVCWLSFSSPS